VALSVKVRTDGKQTQFLLWIGFGGLLALLTLAGISGLSVVRQIQTRNQRIREDYILRDRILEQLRSDIYLSGTYVRDFLLEPNDAMAEGTATVSKLGEFVSQCFARERPRPCGPPKLMKTQSLLHRTAAVKERPSST
jgi:hypothetical protein